MPNNYYHWVWEQLRERYLKAEKSLTKAADMVLLIVRLDIDQFAAGEISDLNIQYFKDYCMKKQLTDMHFNAMTQFTTSFPGVGGTYICF